MDKEVITRSPEETLAFGRAIAKDILRTGSLVLLRGELGAGKTQLSKGIAEYFGLLGEEIASPTYSLVNEYEVTSGDTLYLYHLDCYRFEKPEELIELGVEEYLYPKNAITIIEWPERIETYLPKKRIEVIFEVISPNERRIS
ncbi:MAG: tRNA (adenosine(37)-N6)-threonylcarbamoyltransferase complex ATPase subunit type 1 TsaE, partial [Ignavibacteriota bacterium]